MLQREPKLGESDVAVVKRLQQRIADLFGPEAAELDAVKEQVLQTRKGMPFLFSRILAAGIHS